MTPWLVVLLMWGSFPALLFDLSFGPLRDHGGPAPTFIFWLTREIIWWWLFVVLMAAMFSRASVEGVLNIHDKRDGFSDRQLVLIRQGTLNPAD